jgi:hypothetical protein
MFLSWPSTGHGTVGPHTQSLPISTSRILRICDGTRRLAGVVDEMYLIKVKIGGSGFTGALTRNHKTLVFGAVEVDVDRRCMTGRGVLRVIPNAGTKILRQVIQSCITPGGGPSNDKIPIWNDEWRGYTFLEHPDSGYHRTAVNHSGRVYADTLGRGGNAAECLFKMVRKSLRDMNHVPASSIRRRTARSSCTLVRGFFVATP